MLRFIGAVVVGTIGASVAAALLQVVTGWDAEWFGGFLACSIIYGMLDQVPWRGERN